MSDKITVTLSDNDISANIEEQTVSVCTNENEATTIEEEELCVHFEDNEISAYLEDELLPTNLGTENIIKIVKSIRSYNDLDDKPKINGVELIGNKVPEEIGCVPFELSQLDEIPSTKRGFRETAYLYVNDENGGYRASLEQIKAMSTKIVDCKNVQDVDYTQLSKDDYVYSEE